SKRACGINKFATEFHSGRRVSEQSYLELREFADVFCSCRPTSVRIALPCSHAAAWRVHKHNIEKGFGWELGSAIPQLGAVVENTGPSGATFQNLQAPLRSITRPNQSFVLHQIREMQSFAAFPGTGVPNCLARLRSADQADGLGAD